VRGCDEGCGYLRRIEGDWHRRESPSVLSLNLGE
jgi:hypothetical protein